MKNCPAFMSIMSFLGERSCTSTWQTGSRKRQASRNYLAGTPCIRPFCTHSQPNCSPLCRRAGLLHDCAALCRPECRRSKTQLQPLLLHIPSEAFELFLVCKSLTFYFDPSLSFMAPSIIEGKTGKLICVARGNSSILLIMNARIILKDTISHYLFCNNMRS